MKRLKIDYGIDLGTTNSAICRIESGEPIIKKTDTLKETMPSCVSFTKKKSAKIGDSAFNDLKSDKRRATKNWESSVSNTFIEFKRTMGENVTYHSSFMEYDYTSEELSAEVLKTLKSFIIDEEITSAVVTVPAKFSINQKETTKRAAQMAGIQHCELLQEPIAAAMAYGLTCDQKDGIWLVFDFGGGTFDAALIRVEDGIIQVFDTEGDNYLGGKNLDYAIVDEIIIPHLKSNYTIDSILADSRKRTVLRDAMKTYAEEAKNQLSFKESEDIISNLGDLGSDDNGVEIELDITISQERLSEILSPLFQKAVTICKTLLSRNNLNGATLDSVIMVGGPTYSPILRKMLIEQVSSKIDTSIDPMTAVSRGAALYASTIENNIKEELKTGTIALDVAYESTSVELLEYISVKLGSQNSVDFLSDRLFVELTRSDKAWSSGKVEVNTIGDVIECQLLEGKSNCFSLTVFDEIGTSIPCFPMEITIIQGSKVGNAILPYNIGVEIWDTSKKKSVFKSIKGLKRNQALPAIGVANDLKTTRDLRPGMDVDFIKIPIYQGDDGADGIKAVYFEHVYDAIISGEMVPSLLPSGSDVDITIKVDRSEGMQMEVFFPALNHTEEILFDKDKVQAEVSPEYLSAEINKARNDLAKLKEEGDDVTGLEHELDSVSRELAHGDQKKQVLQHLKEVLRKIDKFETDGEWDRLERALKSKFTRLETSNKNLGNEKSNEMIDIIRDQLDSVIRTKDIDHGKNLLEEINSLFFDLTIIYQLMSFIRYHNDEFSSFEWKDSSRARQLVNQGMFIISNNPSVKSLRPIVIEMVGLLPNSDIPKGAEGLLQQ